MSPLVGALLTKRGGFLRAVHSEACGLLGGIASDFLRPHEESRRVRGCGRGRYLEGEATGNGVFDQESACQPRPSCDSERALNLQRNKSLEKHADRLWIKKELSSQENGKESAYETNRTELRKGSSIPRRGREQAWF